MTLGPQEIVRTEVEGGLEGPANSLTAESIDCGCGRYQLPKLVRFATRRTFLGLLCTVGLLQGAAQAYFHVTNPSIARRYGLDPYLLDWIQCMSEIAPIFVALGVAYWGDRIHRASWLGGLTLLQCVGFLALIIPHVSYSPKTTTSMAVTPDVILDVTGNAMLDATLNATLNPTVNATLNPTINATHLPMTYSAAERSPDLCMRTSSSLMMAEESAFDYATLFILIVVQAINGMANVAFYALGISYLDDNTKRIHVSVYIGLILAIRIIGSVLGSMMGWGFLRIDVDSLAPIQSYRSQTGAWWLGWPIFAFLLTVPAIPLAIFPRKLPSEMVEETAETILTQSGRGSQRLAVKKVGSPDFLPSMLRLLTNKILIFNILAAAFLMTALVNFIANENIFLESRFYAPRPTGMLSGFGDPLVSRVTTTLIKPLLIGLTIIISGLVIARAKPKARTLVYYSLAVLGASALIIFCLALANCDKPPIVGSRRGLIMLLKACNRDCSCSKDADFRPICDSRGKFTFYSPCHAGCTAVNVDGNNVIYNNCTCVEDETGLGNLEARDGPCGSDDCQVGWIIYEIMTLLVYAAASSTMVGDLLISLRSVNVQDKALTIGYSIMILGLIAFVPGKIAYDEMAKSTCQHWGVNSSTCHLHHPTDLGNYLCFLTGGLILVSALLKIGVWFFSPDLEMYDPTETVEPEPREMKDMTQTQAEPLLQPKPIEPEETDNNNAQAVESIDEFVEPIVIEQSKKQSRENGPIAYIDEAEGEPSRLKFGPLGPGPRRTKNRLSGGIALSNTDDELDSDGSQTPRKGSVSLVSYKPLELDSDMESDLSGAQARSRKRIPSTDSNEPATQTPDIRPPFSNIPFPDPDNYEDPRRLRGSNSNSPNLGAESPTEPPPIPANQPLSASRGDFNEIGIPLVETYETTVVKGSTNSLRSPTIMMAIQQLDRNPSRELLEQTKFTYKSTSRIDTEEVEENRKFRLEKLMQPSHYSPITARPPSRDQGSSGFGSLQDMRERLKQHGDTSDSRDSLTSKSSISPVPKKGGPLCTDL